MMEFLLTIFKTPVKLGSGILRGSFKMALRMEVLKEQLEGDLMRRELVAASARQWLDCKRSPRG